MQTHNLGDTKYLLLTRWVMVNILALIFLAVAWKTGWVTKIYAADEVYAVRAIIVLFSCAFLECTWRIWKTSIELNLVRDYIFRHDMEDDRYCKKIESGDSRLAGYLDSLLAAQPVDRFILAEDLRTNLSHEISRVGYMLPRLTAVGLTCTFLGMILALEGFNPAHLTDISKIVEVFRLTPRGMSVAFNAGLVSMVAYLWLEGLFQILQSGTVKLSSATIRAGVRFVRN